MVVAAGDAAGNSTRFDLAPGINWEEIGLLALVDPVKNQLVAHVVVQKLGPGALQV